MKTNFLSLLFFCGACVSTFGQELQSPQINQNAIFANPGLAGSKGQSRICTALSMVNLTPSYGNTYNGLVSADGLIFKNKIGIAGYLKNERLQTNQLKTHTFTYTNMYAGIMFAPKFHIYSTNIKKSDKVFSPSIGIGLKATQFDYSGDSLKNHSYQNPLLYDGLSTKSLSVDYLSLGLLYSTQKGYIGLKFNANFNPNNSKIYLYDLSIVIARSYFNSKISNPKFSFNPQFYFAFPINQFNYNLPFHNYIDRQNQHVISSFMTLNLDFRYKKIIFGTFTNWTINNGLYAGLTIGAQLKTMKIIANYAPEFSKNDNFKSGLFISANFLLQPKKSTYK